MTSSWQRYQRAQAIRDLMFLPTPMVRNATVYPHWQSDSLFVHRREVPDGQAVVQVNAVTLCADEVTDDALLLNTRLFTEDRRHTRQRQSV